LGTSDKITPKVSIYVCTTMQHFYDDDSMKMQHFYCDDSRKVFTFFINRRPTSIEKIVIISVQFNQAFE